MLKPRIERFGIKRRDLAISAAVGIIIAATIITFRLGAFGVSAGQPVTIPDIAANAPAPLAPLTVKASRQEVIALMLNSHSKWRTIEGKATTLWRADGTSPIQSSETVIQVQQFGKVRVESGPVGAPPTYVWVSDGNMIWEENPQHNTYIERRVPESARSLETYGPPAPPADGKAFVIRYPLDGLIGSVLSEFIYPHGIAQAMGSDKLEIVGADNVAGRDTVVVLRQGIDSKGILYKKHKYWIDARTGAMLKREGYGESTGWDKWVEQTTFTSIVYDRPIPSEKFIFRPSPGAKQLAPDVSRP